MRPAHRSTQNGAWDAPYALGRDNTHDDSEVPAAQRRQLAKPLEYYTKKHPDRDEAIRQAYAIGGYGMKEMGEHFGLHYSWVSRIIARAGKAKGKRLDPDLRTIQKLVERVKVLEGKAE